MRAVVKLVLRPLSALSLVMSTMGTLGEPAPGGHVELKALCRLRGFAGQQKPRPRNMMKNQQHKVLMKSTQSHASLGNGTSQDAHAEGGLSVSLDGQSRLFS